MHLGLLYGIGCAGPSRPLREPLLRSFRDVWQYIALWRQQYSMQELCCLLGTPPFHACSFVAPSPGQCEVPALCLAQGSHHEWSVQLLCKELMFALPEPEAENSSIIHVFDSKLNTSLFRCVSFDIAFAVLLTVSHGHVVKQYPTFSMSCSSQCLQANFLHLICIAVVFLLIVSHDIWFKIPRLCNECFPLGQQTVPCNTEP